MHSNLFSSNTHHPRSTAVISGDILLSRIRLSCRIPLPNRLDGSVSRTERLPLFSLLDLRSGQEPQLLWELGERITWVPLGSTGFALVLEPWKKILEMGKRTKKKRRYFVYTKGSESGMGFIKEFLFFLEEGNRISTSQFRSNSVCSVESGHLYLTCLCTYGRPVHLYVCGVYVCVYVRGRRINL